MELEEARNKLYYLQHINTYLDLDSEQKFILDRNTLINWKLAIETVLKELENSISKDKVIEKIKMLEKSNVFMKQLQIYILKELLEVDENECK